MKLYLEQIGGPRVVSGTHRRDRSLRLQRAARGHLPACRTDGLRSGHHHCALTGRRRSARHPDGGRDADGYLHRLRGLPADRSTPTSRQTRSSRSFDAIELDAWNQPVKGPEPMGGWESYWSRLPEYPRTLRNAGLEGTVIVEGRIGTQRSSERLEGDV